MRTTGGGLCTEKSETSNQGACGKRLRALNCRIVYLLTFHRNTSIVSSAASALSIDVADSACPPCVSG